MSTFTLNKLLFDDTNKLVLLDVNQLLYYFVNKYINELNIPIEGLHKFSVLQINTAVQQVYPNINYNINQHELNIKNYNSYFNYNLEYQPKFTKEESIIIYQNLVCMDNNYRDILLKIYMVGKYENFIEEKFSNFVKTILNNKYNKNKYQMI